MTTRGVPVPASILFTIDGRQGILGARQIAEAFHIPYAPADPAAFRHWAPLSEWDMVRILSRGISLDRIIMRKELPPRMLLVDVVLRANLFPLQHRVQRQGTILKALFRISEGYYFGPQHLIMAALLHFEEKTLILRPAAIVERASLLTNGIRYFSINIPQNFPSQGKFLHSPYHLYLLRPLQLSRSPYQRQHRLMPHLLFLLPQSHPITIPGAEYRDLLASFQSLTTTQTAIMERMDHFQVRQDQQTLILREIQQHLGLLPPAPPVAPMPSEPSTPADDATPVAVPSTVAAEDPSYPPKEPTT
ncbi:hypothetical protein CK203_110399 [Vitis vinifera]|uniref:Uncharacterized protein n=1 Tax=Vitis vinifera TaxID=29760 RepID=A0A438BP82_VITVI|nr:hypothetical protein CK203_110399 [Vitis vinifera]